jgi:hypothetical protein
MKKNSFKRMYRTGGELGYDYVEYNSFDVLYTVCCFLTVLL